MTRARDVANQINRVNSSAADATAITIDSSENVLVGKTSAGLSTAGVQLDATGSGGFCRAETCLTLSRLSTDGSILDFRKDSTTVGSIGSKGDQLYIGTGDTGLKFLPSSDSVVGATSVDGSGRDGAIDLGLGGSRFKDLYLSGGVFLGGTGAANKLDDYEESYMTAALTCASGTITVNSSYDQMAVTKIGRMVYLSGRIRISAISSPSGQLQINLPYTTASLNEEASFNYLKVRTHGSGLPPLGDVFVEFTANVATGSFFYTRDDETWVFWDASEVRVDDIISINGYFTAA